MRASRASKYAWIVVFVMVKIKVVSALRVGASVSLNYSIWVVDPMATCRRLQWQSCEEAWGESAGHVTFVTTTSITISKNCKHSCLHLHLSVPTLLVIIFLYEFLERRPTLSSRRNKDHKHSRNTTYQKRPCEVDGVGSYRPYKIPCSFLR